MKMITITIYGLDQYTVGHYSKDHTTNLASLFETEEDDISFIAPENYVFHKGVEQTSWDTIVRVHAPCRFRVLEEKVADYILRTLKEFTINVTVEFDYYEIENRYTYNNKEYPRFIREDNVASVEEETLDEGEELCEENMFANFEEKLEEAKNKNSGECHDENCKDHKH